jgi:hypothetical protein
MEQHTPIPLKDGSVTFDPRLDRIYEEDWRTLNHLLSAALPLDNRTPTTKVWDLNAWLDQGMEGACVGFGCGHDLLATPVPVTQREDPWPGGAYPGADPFYEGTSVLTGMKVLTDLGYYTSYDWALTTREAALGVAYAGPAVLGLNWYEGMGNTDHNGYILPTGALVGGHCILASGVVIYFKAGTTTKTWADVDYNASYFILHNSWSRAWGENGRAKLALRDFDRLLAENGEACFPNRNPDRLSVVVEEEVDVTYPFNDIEGSVHADNIVWAEDMGLLSGFPDGSFKPNNLLTRGQMATVLKRFYDLLQP